MENRVIFRKFGEGDIIALFLDYEWNEGIKKYVNSYMHIGQHGGADYALVIKRTKPAKPSEYMELAEELRQRGYKLHVMGAENKLWRMLRPIEEGK